MILIATQTFAPVKGGMEAYMTGLAEELSRAGYGVIVFADGKDKGFKPQADYILRRFSGWRPLRRNRKRRAIDELMRAQRIEAVFCDSWKSIEALPANIAVPIAVLGHGAEYPVSPPSRKRKRICQALARVDLIFANSRFTANAIHPYLPKAEDPRLQIVHPPIHPLPNPSPEALAWIRGYIGDKYPVLSVVARLEPRKGVDRVIGAMPALLAKYPQAVFLVGGVGEDTSRLHALAEEKGVGDHVLFLGQVDPDKRSALLARSDIFAMPVRRVGTSVEGFGISYIEAGWFGVPCLGGTDCGAEDAVIDEKTGLLCDGDNQTEIITRLLRLLDDNELRRRLGLAARDRAQNELLWSRLLPRFLDILRPDIRRRIS